MARGKKKESALTQEEKLAQALVPDWEWPYKVPDNWCFFYFTSLIDIEGGTQPPKSQFIDEPRDGYARLIQIRDFATDKYTVYVPDTPKMRHLEEKDILIARYGASLGRICTGQKGVYNVALAKTIFSESALNRKYVFWMLQSETFQNPLTQLSRTAQAGFNKDDLSGFAMPLAPLVEQQRIVDRIEYLFNKLDEAKEKAQSVLDCFETRKAAILHKAFTGELTAKWRAEHDVNMTGWTQSRLGTYADSQYGYTESATTDPVGPYFLRITDIQDGQVNWSNVPYCKIDPEKKTQYAIRRGDIVVARTGATTGKSYLVIDDVDAVYASYLIRVSLKSDLLNNYYLHAFMQTPEYWRQISDFSSGIAQPGVNGKKLKELELPIPPVPEQIEIVRILDSLLAKEQQAKEAAEAVLEQIDLMKKSILARAFRGELGTNDPTEPSALDLLKAII